MNADRTKRRLESQHSHDSPETVIMKRKKRKPAEFHRSKTISSFRPTSATPGSSNHQPVYSPLERFHDAKNEISRAFSHINNCLVEAQTFLKEAHCKGGEEKMDSLMEKTKGIEEVLDRDHMKVAFFGRTSNGKSTVVNALLQDEVLPTGVGHITSCFCSVRGASSSEGYVLVPGSEEKKSVTVVQKLAHCFHKDRLSESSLLKVYWPQSKCTLLQEDVELVDSPGVDLNNPSVDECINQHCLDADVFVLVLDATALLSIAEETFFHYVSQRLSRPNIFILINRWDLTVQDPELMDDEPDSVEEEAKMIEDLKKQHLETAVRLLSQKLKVTDKETAVKRVYFVSAKEVLLQRIREHDEDENLYQGFADGHRQRLVEFERFEEQFKESLSSSAIHTKFEKHHQRGMDILIELDDLLREEERKILNSRESVSCDLKEAERYKQRLVSEGSSLQESCQSKVSRTVENTEKEFSKAIGNVVRQFEDIASGYNAEFDLRRLESYKAGLFEHVDSSLRQMLQELGSSTLHSLHDEACADITGCYQRVLGASLAEMQQLSSQIRAPKLTYVLCCADLCEDFKEELDFRFSLGLDRLKIWINSGAVLFNAQQQLTQLLSFIPSDLVFPLTVLLGGLVVSRMFSWQFLVPPVAIYCSMYVYEKLTWTERSQEQALRRQFVSHLESKFHLQVGAIRTSYVVSLDRSLKRLLGSLGHTVHEAQIKQDLEIQKNREEVSLLTRLNNQAHDLRNNVHHLKTHLETFKENYLNDVD